MRTRRPTQPGWYAVRVERPDGRELPRVVCCAERGGAIVCEFPADAGNEDPVDVLEEPALFEGPFATSEDAHDALFPAQASKAPTVPGPLDRPPASPPVV